MKNFLKKFSLPIATFILALLTIGGYAAATSITTINGSDTLNSTRAVLNANFAALNNGKMEKTSTSSDTILSLPNLTGLRLDQGGTGFNSLANGYLPIGSGSSTAMSKISSSTLILNNIGILTNLPNLASAGGYTIQELANTPYVTVCASSSCDYVTDGTADDVQINLAIRKSSSTGAIILIKDGTYNITDSIYLASNINILGNGNKTVLQSSISDNNRDIIDSDGSTLEKNNISIKNLKIVGSGNERNAIFIDYSSNILIQGLDIHGMRTNAISFYNGTSFFDVLENYLDLQSSGQRGIYIDGDCHDYSVKDNKIYNTLYSAIELDDIDGSPILYPYNGVVSGNIISSSSIFGILNEGAKNTSISSNILNNCGGVNYAAIGISSESEKVENVSVIDNKINNTPTSSGAIIISGKTKGASEIVVSGNIINSTKTHGINVSNIQNSSISNNVIKNILGTNGRAIYFQLVSGSGNDNIEIIGNQVDGATECIYLSGASSNISVIGNSLKNCSSRGIRMQSQTKLIVSNNIIEEAPIGIIGGGSSARNDYSNISGNIISSSSVFAVSIDYTNHFIFSNNIFKNNSTAGSIGSNSNNLTIFGNQFNGQSFTNNVASSSLYLYRSELETEFRTASSSLGTIHSGLWNGTKIDFSGYTNATSGDGIKFTGDEVSMDINGLSPTTTISNDSTFAVNGVLGLFKISWSTIVSTLQNFFNSVYLTLSGGTMAGNINMGNNDLSNVDEISAASSSVGIVRSGTWNGSAIDISSYTNLTCSATGLQLSGDDIAWSSGYEGLLTSSKNKWDAMVAASTTLDYLPLSALSIASSSQLKSFWETPSGRISAGTGLSWSGNTINSKWTSSGNDIYNNNSGNIIIGGVATTSSNSLSYNPSKSTLYIAPIGIGTATSSQYSSGRSEMCSSNWGSETNIIDCWGMQSKSTATSRESDFTLDYQGNTVMSIAGLNGSSYTVMNYYGEIVANISNTGISTPIRAITVRNRSSNVNNNEAIYFRNANNMAVAYISAKNLSHSSTVGSADLSLWTANGGAATEKFTVKANGYVGIGSTSPRSLLDVYNGYITQDGVYGEVYFSDATTSQAILTGATYQRLNAFNANGLSKNVTASSSEIIITIPGVYQVESSVSGTSQTNNVSFKTAIFLNGVEQNACHSERKYSIGHDIGNSGITCKINVTSANSVVDLRTRHDNAGTVNYELVYGNINVNYIGEAQ